MSHTKLPWVAIAGSNENEKERFSIYSEGAFNKAVTGWGCVRQSKDDAALIVKAVNSHQQLVDALEDVKRRIEESDNWWMDEPTRGGFDMGIINAALAKAKS